MTQIAQAPAEVKKRITFEEFLAWDGENQHVEWVDGEVVVMPPASNEHQLIMKFLIKILDDYVEAKDLGLVLPPPFLMRLDSPPRGREPDLLFVAKANLDRVKPTYIDGPADLAVEIVSPESGDRDRGAKFYEYEQAGVREFWLIDPIRKQAEFHQRGADGYFHSVPLSADGRYHSAVLEGMWIDVSWLWQAPRPRSRDVYRLWGLS